MLAFETENIIKVLQASVAPCLLISGFGFLLLTMTNRIGRATDRIRALAGQLKQQTGDDFKKTCLQIGILYKRCRLLQAAIVFLTFSIFFVGINVLLLFSSITLQLNLKSAIEFCFAASIIALIISLSIFLIDISVTLQSLKIEIGESTRKH